MPESKVNIGPRIVLEGEAEYRQSINNVNKSMSVMKSELKAVASEFVGNANSIDALRAKNEILLKQQTEQEKKLQLLRGALEKANALYGQESTQVQNWQIKLNNAYADLHKLNREIDSNSKYLKEAENSTDRSATSIDRFGKEVKTAGDNAEKAGGQFKTHLSGAAVVAGVAALGYSVKRVSDNIVDLVKSTASYADEILTLSAQTGIATDTLQELKYMQDLTDVSLETVTNSMAKQIKSMANAQKGTEDYVNTYKKLGIEITNADGSLRNSNEVYWEVIDALGQMSNETERDANAMMLLGKSAQDINPVIKIGSSGVAEFAKEARNMGAVLSNETIRKLGETDDALQRMYQQIAASKRSMGADIAPAVTEAFQKITDKVDEVDDKFANFAEGSIGAVVDGFLWIVDNADFIESGLKGITAGIITKKAADGIIYAVDAYKTLTLATQTATAAQTAFNVASKANVIGAIASVVIGAGTAIYSYAKSTSEAAEETRKLNDESYKLIENSNKVSETVQNNIEDREKSLSVIEAEANATLKLVDSLFDLSEEEGKSNVSKQQMLSLVEQINEAMPDLNLSIDEQTGLLSKQRREVEKLVKAHIELSTAEALKSQLSDIALDRYNQEKALNDLLDVQAEKKEKLKTLDEEYNMAYFTKPIYNNSINAEALRLQNEIQRITEEFNENEISIEKAKKAISDLGVKYEEALNYIGNHSEIDAATGALDKFLSKYKETLDNQNEAYANGLDDRVDVIENTYIKSENLLDKSQKAEKKALEKSQKDLIEVVEDTSEEELKILEKKHKKKLELIDEEYLEKMKLVDEDRYNELKKVQDQIDAIDNQAEAEERARKLREQAEKRSELTLQVASAKTAEDRLEAQKELTDFEEDTARDRLKTERDLQKDILEQQKETIDDAYDAKIEALEKAKQKEEEKASENYEIEKLAIAERYEIKKQEIADIQELETLALEDKQRSEQDAVDKQKEYAVQKAKETYEEDLTQFKLNNALKYDEAVANHDAIRKYIGENAFSSSGGFEAAQREFAKTNIWDSDYALGNNYRLAQNTASLAIDYEKIEDSMVAAVKSMKWEIVMDNKKVGTLVEKRVNNMIR